MEKFKNLVIRALSGLVLAVIILGGILYNSYSLCGILFLVSMLTLNEFITIIDRSRRVIHNRWYILVVGALLYVAMVYPQLPVVRSLLIILIGVRFFFEIYKNKELQLNSLAMEMLSLIYTVVPMALLAQTDDKLVVVMVIAIVWANDIGAYLVGMLFGRTKLMESISPKKTIEGFVGGMVLAIIVGTNYGYYFLGMDIALCGVLSIGVSVAAVAGDLFESMIKRNIGVKDSGNIMPGHGGMLDRFDALLFAAPTYYALSELLSHIF